MRARPDRTVPRTRRAPRRRGVALVLVLVAFGTGATLGSAYLTSRSGSAAIAANVARSATADWTTRSAANIGVAVLQTSVAPSALPTAGAVFTGMTIGPATVNAYITNLQGQPPTAADTDLLLTTVATAGTVKTVGQRTVSFKPSMSVANAIDPEMGEYALYANVSLRIDANATVGLWSGSPAARAARAAKIGLGFASRSGLVIDPAARLVSVMLFPSAGAAASLQTDIATRFCGGKILGLSPKSIGFVVPAAVSSAPVVTLLDRTITGGQATLPAGRHSGVYPEKGAVVTIGAAGTPTSYVFDELDVSTQAVLHVEGQVALWVKGAVTIRQQGGIEMGPGSTLTMYLGDSLSVDDGAIGADRAMSRATGRVASTLDPSFTPSRLRILGVQRLLALGTPTVEFGSGSVVVAAIHTPGADVDVDGSTVVGRITGRAVRLRSGSALFYDPRLDNGAGYTALDGPLYAAGGSPLPSLSLALSGFVDALGAAALPASVQSALRTAGVVDALGVPTNLGGAARSAQRASATDWPAAALAQEKRNVTGSGLTLGLVTTPVTVQPGDSVLTLGAGGTAQVQGANQ